MYSCFYTFIYNYQLCVYSYKNKIWTKAPKIKNVPLGLMSLSEPNLSDHNLYNSFNNTYITEII